MLCKIYKLDVSINYVKKMKMKIQLVVLATLMVACGHKQKENAAGDNSQAIRVKTETVQTMKGSSELKYSGTIEPSQSIPLTFQSSGIVSAVLVQEGDMVRKGQLLATVDKSDNENMYTASMAKYNQAKDAYDRLKTVHDNGSLTEIKWVEMETNLAQAKSQMEITKSNLEKCNMRAPDNGMIGARNVEPGQSALTSTTPLELVKIDNVYVKISVPENEISRIRKGMKASFVVSALGGKSFDGEVSNVGVVADRIARTYEVKILVKNTNLDIKPGMVCDVTLNIGSPNDVMVISYSSVSRDNDGKPFVFVVSTDGKSVKKQNITVGNFQQTGVEVLSGLIPGQTIVSEGKEKLSDNSLISL
jgi:RND family efflux transporter MFP subunit